MGNEIHDQLSPHPLSSSVHSQSPPSPLTPPATNFKAVTSGASAESPHEADGQLLQTAADSSSCALDHIVVASSACPVAVQHGASFERLDSTASCEAHSEFDTRFGTMMEVDKSSHHLLPSADYATVSNMHPANPVDHGPDSRTAHAYSDSSSTPMDKLQEMHTTTQTSAAVPQNQATSDVPSATPTDSPCSVSGCDATETNESSDCHASLDLSSTSACRELCWRKSQFIAGVADALEQQGLNADCPIPGAAVLQGWLRRRIAVVARDLGSCAPCATISCGQLLGDNCTNTSRPCAALDCLVPGSAVARVTQAAPQFQVSAESCQTRPSIATPSCTVDELLANDEVPVFVQGEADILPGLTPPPVYVTVDRSLSHEALSALIASDPGFKPEFVMTVRNRFLLQIFLAEQQLIMHSRAHTATAQSSSVATDATPKQDGVTTSIPSQESAAPSQALSMSVVESIPPTQATTVATTVATVTVATVPSASADTESAVLSHTETATKGSEGLVPEGNAVASPAAATDVATQCLYDGSLQTEVSREAFQEDTDRLSGTKILYFMPTTDIAAIVRQGLDQTCFTDAFFGRGLQFFEDPLKANDMSPFRGQPTSLRCMLRCRVAVGSSKEYPTGHYDRHLQAAPTPHQSVKGYIRRGVEYTIFRPSQVLVTEIVFYRFLNTVLEMTPSLAMPLTPASRNGVTVLITASLSEFFNKLQGRAGPEGSVPHTQVRRAIGELLRGKQTPAAFVASVSAVLHAPPPANLQEKLEAELLKCQLPQ